MAITTDSYYDIVYDEETLDRIGLSETLDNYSISEIADYAYVGSYSYYGKQMMSKSLSGYTYVGFSELNGSCPFAANFHSGTYETIDVEDGQTENYNLTENGLYRRVILLNAVNGQYVDVINDISNYKIITEFDAPKYTIDLGNKSDMLFESTPYWYYDNVGGTTRYNTHLGAADNVQIATCGFAAYVIIPFNSTYYILRASLFSRIFEAYSINNSYIAHCSDVFTDYTGNNPAAIAETVVEWFKNYDFTNADSTPIVHPLNTSIDYWAPFDGYCSLIRFSGGAMGFFQHFMFTDETKLMTFLAGMYGLHFIVDGTVYKPIITDNFVLGYSDDLNVESDLDNYVGSTKHDLPVTPPTPPTPPTPSGDDMEAMATGATGSSGGFTHFYIMSPQDLIDLLSDFYTHADPGETISNNLVCSYILGIPSSEFCATESVPVAIHNSAQGTPFVSQANYAHVTATNNLLVVGTFNVPRITNTFYDFAPYSTYEVFIPCCGWVSLPDTVAGRSINVEIYIDIASCCLKAAIKTNDLGVCAVANGVLGAAIPMAVIESGILRGNNIQAGLGIIGGGINTGVGAGSGNTMGIGFGVQQILSGLIDCTVAGNTNYTQQKGGTGDITQFAMGHKCYMKITHPDIDPVVNNSIFGHSVGYLCNAIDTLSNFTGFTVCGNPHVTFSASAEEREEIERLLSMGVIL